MGSAKLLVEVQHLIRLLCLSCLAVLVGCEFDEKPLSQSERETACVNSYLERFDINITEGPQTDDFFSELMDDHTFFSMVKVGSSEASAILYLLPVIPSQNQIGRISNQEFEQLSQAYNQQAKEGGDVDLALQDTKTFKVFQELNEVVQEKLKESKKLINGKLCTLTYLIGEDQRREDQRVIIDAQEGCYMEAPTGARFVAPDEKELYVNDFRDQLNQIKDSVALRPIPLWRSNWASNEFGACLLYAFSKRVEEDEFSAEGLEQE